MPEAWAVRMACSLRSRTDRASSRNAVPGRGQPHAAASAFEEGDADLVLQLADLAAEGGLGDTQATGGPGEVQFIGDADEVAQVPEFHGADDPGNAARGQTGSAGHDPRIRVPGKAG